MFGTLKMVSTGKGHREFCPPADSPLASALKPTATCIVLSHHKRRYFVETEVEVLLTLFFGLHQQAC